MTPPLQTRKTLRANLAATTGESLTRVWIAGVAFICFTALACNAATTTATPSSPIAPAVAPISTPANGAAKAASTPINSTVAPAAKSVATTPAAPTAPTFDSFRLIAERNIFDPNRVGRSAQNNRREAQPTGDTITLVGTMQYEKGYFAFFDSPNAKFRAALTATGTVADFTVKQVTANSVELTRNGQSIHLAISQQLYRPVGGDWTLSAAPARMDIAANSDASASTGASTAIPADASETLKRLMEQRKKELKQ